MNFDTTECVYDMCCDERVCALMWSQFITINIHDNNIYKHFDIAL